MKKMRLTTIIALLGMAALTSCTKPDVEINKENFPDENFRYYLLDQDYGADGKLTAEEMDSVRKINVRSMNISSLKGLENFTKLEVLLCDSNKLTKLDVTLYAELTRLNCGSNRLNSLDVSKNLKLIGLVCHANNLSELDVTQNTKLERLLCWQNNLAALDVTNNTKLEALGCYNNKLTELDVSRNGKLDALRCDEKKIKIIK